MSTDTEEGRWICAACGTRHDSNEQPCRNCASEQFAKLEEPDTHRIQESASITWVCDECGTTAPRNNSPCRNCGSFNYSKQATNRTQTQQRTDVGKTTTSKTVTFKTIVAYLGGLLALANCLGAVIIGSGGAVLFAGAIVVSLPPARRRLEQRTGVELTTAAAAILYLLLTVVGNMWFVGTAL